MAATFKVGDLTATGLDRHRAHAVVCVDAMQFAAPQTAGYDELRRVTASGGRVVLTCWEPIDRADPRVPDLLRQVDLGAGLAAAGFDNIVVSGRRDQHD